jgi:uncharacterized protein (TIGR03435 family)
VKLELALLILVGVGVTTQAETFEFEVASIKPNTSSAGVSGGCYGVDSKKLASDVQVTIPLGRCVITSARLSHLMAIAYRIQVQNLKGGPEWVWGSERFDVDAKAENPSTTTEEQLLSMLQNLLADRFRLKFHRETKRVSGYALVVAKNGPKLKEATGDGNGSLRIAGAAIFKPDAIERRNLDQNSMVGQKASMQQLANALTNLPENAPVVDKTDLHGLYDFKLKWEPGESLSSVLQEQLGLKLEAVAVPIETLIIDSAELPREN